MPEDDEDGRPLWPNVKRYCFTEGSKRGMNACVRWVLDSPHQMVGYAEGYRRAAHAVYESLSSQGSPDFAFFPLAFLWRHYIELALKDVISMGQYLNDQPRVFPTTHSLNELWKKAKPHIIRCGAEDAPELSNVEANIQEFEKVDPRAEGFRYPLNRDQDGASMPDAPMTVNLQTLHEGMTALANFLDAVRMALSVRTDAIDEMKAEYALNG